MASKSKGLRRNEMERALKKLAELHAASAVDYELRGPFSENFSRGIYNVDMKEMFDSNYDFNFTFVVDDCLSTWPELDKRIIDKMVSDIACEFLVLNVSFHWNRKTGATSSSTS